MSSQGDSRPSRRSSHGPIVNKEYEVVTKFVDAAGASNYYICPLSSFRTGPNTGDVTDSADVIEACSSGLALQCHFKSTGVDKGTPIHIGSKLFFFKN